MYSKNKLFIFFSISFIVGIFISNILQNFTKSIFVLLIIIVLFFTFFLYIKKYLIYILFLILGFFLAVGFSNYNYSKINYKKNYISQYIDKKNNYDIKIEKLYKNQEFYNIYVGEIKKINNIKNTNNIKGLFYIQKGYNINLGNIINFNSKIYKFKNFNNFDYENFMLSKGLYFNSYIYSFEITDNIKNNIIINFSNKIKKSFINNINNIFPENESIFLAGILIGSKENINKELENNFNNSGLTHLIAVSGFNITIIIIFLSYVLQVVPNMLKIIIISYFIIFFSILAGLGSSVIRASIMGLIGYYIIASGRKGEVLSILCFTLILMIIFSPLSINYDISLHLSFLAVVGIIYTQKFFSNLFSFLPNFLEIKQAFVLSLSSLIFTLPIIIFNFGQLSILSAIANVLVGWTIPLSMLFGFISILIYYISNILGIFIGFFAWIFLKWSILMVNFFGSQDWAILKYNFGKFDNIIEIIYFIILIFFIIYFRKKEEQI